MEQMSMKMSLVELYQLVGDNTGVSFLYEELPGVVVTIGFTLEEEEDDENGNDDDGSDGDDGEDFDDADGEQSARGRSGKKLH
jgi:hypothetical protein